MVYNDENIKMLTELVAYRPAQEAIDAIQALGLGVEGVRNMLPALIYETQPTTIVSVILQNVSVDDSTVIGLSIIAE
jgi:hypothetical protein